MDGVLPRLPLHGDDDGAPAVEPRDERVLVEAVLDHRHLPQCQLAAVRTGVDDHALVVRAGVGAPARADGHIPRVRAHHARGQVHGGGADGVPHLAEGQPVLAQRLLRDLDADLIRAHPGQRAVGDGRQRGDLVAHLLAQPAQVALGHVRGDDHIDHGVKAVVHLHHRPLGQFRKVRDGVQPAAHLLHHLPRVPPLLDLDEDRPAAGPRRGVDLLDAAHLLDGLLNRQHDALLHLLRRAPGIGHRHRDNARGHVREHLQRDAPGEQAPKPGHGHAGHQQVGGDVIAGEPGDHGREV